MNLVLLQIIVPCAIVCRGAWRTCSSAVVYCSISTWVRHSSLSRALLTMYPELERFAQSTPPKKYCFSDYDLVFVAIMHFSKTTKGGGINRRRFSKIFLTSLGGLPPLLGQSEKSAAGEAAKKAETSEKKWDRQDRLFPIDIPTNEWHSFPAAGFKKPACGIVYRRITHTFV